jgi:hypothetical protein
MTSEDDQLDGTTDAEPLFLRPSPLKWLMVFIVCFGFVLIALFVMKDGQKSKWFCAILFGAGAIISSIQLIPGVSHLRLDTEGFTTRTFFRDWFVAWRDVESFTVVKVHTGHATTTMVGFNYFPQAAARRKLAALGRMVSGVDGCLNDTYGYKPDDLAALMEEWRRMYG